jgi:hypothetical protein
VTSAEPILDIDELLRRGNAMDEDDATDDDWQHVSADDYSLEDFSSVISQSDTDDDNVREGIVRFQRKILSLMEDESKPDTRQLIHKCLLTLKEYTVDRIVCSL